MEGGRYPGVIKVLLVGVASSPALCFVILVHVGGDYKDDGWNPCSILNAYHG